MGPVSLPNEGDRGELITPAVDGRINEGGKSLPQTGTLLPDADRKLEENDANLLASPATSRLSETGVLAALPPDTDAISGLGIVSEAQLAVPRPQPRELTRVMDAADSVRTPPLPLDTIGDDTAAAQDDELPDSAASSQRLDTLNALASELETRQRVSPTPDRAVPGAELRAHLRADLSPRDAQTPLASTAKAVSNERRASQLRAQYDPAALPGEVKVASQPNAPTRTSEPLTASQAQERPVEVRDLTQKAGQGTAALAQSVDATAQVQSNSSSASSEPATQAQAVSDVGTLSGSGTSSPVPSTGLPTPKQAEIPKLDPKVLATGDKALPADQTPIKPHGASVPPSSVEADKLSMKARKVEAQKAEPADAPPQSPTQVQVRTATRDSELIPQAIRMATRTVQPTRLSQPAAPVAKTPQRLDQQAPAKPEVSASAPVIPALNSLGQGLAVPLGEVEADTDAPRAAASSNLAAPASPAFATQSSLQGPMDANSLQQSANPLQPASAPSAPQPASPAPLTDTSSALRLSPQLESTIDQLTEARSNAQANRPELTVRHQEFGAITMRVDATGGDLRATLSARDPGFVPAIQTALAERGVTASGETATGMSQRQDQQTSQNNPQGNSQSGSYAGSQFQGQGQGWGQGSGTNYGSSTGEGQGTSQPYAGQTGSQDDDTGSDPAGRTGGRGGPAGGGRAFRLIFAHLAQGIDFACLTIRLETETTPKKAAVG